MLDMGIEPYLLSSALIGVLAQRLIRKVCPHCATHYQAPPHSLDHLGQVHAEPIKLIRGRGCEQCFDSGYQGRVAIHELLKVNSETRNLILTQPEYDVLEAHRQSSGHLSLLGAGMHRALAGDTSVDEVLRVVNSDGD